MGEVCLHAAPPSRAAQSASAGGDGAIEWTSASVLRRTGGRRDPTLRYTSRARSTGDDPCNPSGQKHGPQKSDGFGIEDLEDRDLTKSLLPCMLHHSLEESAIRILTSTVNYLYSVIVPTIRGSEEGRLSRSRAASESGRMPTLEVRWNLPVAGNSRRTSMTCSKVRAWPKAGGMKNYVLELRMRDPLLAIRRWRHLTLQSRPEPALVFVPQIEKDTTGKLELKLC